MAENTFIKDLEKAFNDVDKSYITYDTYIGLTKGEKIADSTYFSSFIKKTYVDDYILSYLDNQKQFKEQSLERNFCYELYFTWKTIIKRNNNKTYDGLVLNGEVSKTNLAKALENYENIKNSQLFEKIKEKGLIDKTHFVPDLVLHSGQNNIEKQQLIVEVKYSDSLKKGKFEIDFYKLALYQKLYQFSDCVFLIINITIKDILEYLKKVDTSVVDKSGIWFMIRTEQKIYTFNLNDLV